MVSVRSGLNSVISPEGGAILNASRNRILTLNHTGAFVWNLLEKGVVVEQIIEELRSATNAEGSVVEKGVHIFLKQLEAKELITI